MTNTGNKEALILCDRHIFPGEEVLKAALRSDYALYPQFTAAAAQLGVNSEWNYYRDSKSWLCRWIKGKKTIFWLSVWNDGLKAAFYFSPRTRDGVFDLEIDEAIKKELASTPLKWRLYALVLHIDRHTFDDALTIARYKTSLK